jgi:hypothetical protein
VLQAFFFLSSDGCEFFYSHFPVISRRLDQFSGKYFDKSLRITSYKSSIRISATLDEDERSPDVKKRHVYYKI